MLQLIKTYKLTTVLLIVIWVLCFMPIPETPLSHVQLIDKWTHTAMYLGLGLVIAFEYERAHHPQASSWSLFVYVGLLPSLMGGLIELLQAYCTGGRRSGEWLDLLADVVGAVLATIIGMPSLRDRGTVGVQTPRRCASVPPPPSPVPRCRHRTHRPRRCGPRRE